ncbi:MAG: M1 family metallopeptidase [Chloroflexia bacterium]|nr:M1 family metallopeptidase [Chloroflexia bacterium]
MKNRLCTLLLWGLILLLPACSGGTPQVQPTATAAAPTARPTIAAKPTLPPPSATPAETIRHPQNLSIGDPYAPALGNGGYDAQRYVLRLALDPQTRRFEARAAIEAQSTMDGLEQVSLDLVGLEIQEVQVDGAAAPFLRQGHKLLVDLPAPLPTGAPFRLEVAYSGEPLIEPSAYVPFVSHLGLHHQLGQSLFVVAEPDGARYWYPCNDHPRDKAAYRIELAVPAGLVGVANGVLVETQAGGQTLPDGQSGDLYVWEHPSPLASAFVTVAVGDYRRVEGTSPQGVPLRHYVRPEEVATMERLNPTLGAMIDWLGERFGPYPFEAFGYVTVSGLGASLETQSMVILDSGALGDENVMLHEMVHMWFGDWVSLDSWAEIWRSEGFATYVPLLWEYQGDPQALEQHVQALQESPGASTHPLNNPPPGRMFGRDSYYKGAALAHELRLEIGDEAFFAGLRRYFELYGGGTAGHQEFQAALEEAAGRSLEEFFAAWFE